MINDLTNRRLLSNVQRPDLIEYESEYVAKNLFIVYDVDKDQSIPALLVQLWKFTGGYDHGMYNIVVNDFAINQTVEVLKPKIHSLEVVEINSYRKENNDIVGKEKFIMDINAKETSITSDDEFYLPYECIVILNQIEITLVIPDWTPLQNLPVDRIKVGTDLIIWEQNEIFSIMSVKKL